MLNRLIATIAILLVSVMAFTPTAIAARGPLKDAIIAIVNNEVITLKDLSMYISSLRSQLRIENKTALEINEIMAEYEQKGIEKLIEDKLILAAADDKGIIIRDEIINKKVKEIRARYANEDEFLAVISSQGMTVSDLRKKLANQMKAKFIVDIEVREKTFVNPQDVTKYYNEHTDDFERKTRYSLKSIYIPDENGRQEANNKAFEARSKILAGADFDAVQKEYSKAPSIGTIEQGQMVPAIEDKIAQLKLSEVSEPLEVDGGVYIFQMVGVSPGRQQSLQEAKEQIYNRLFDQRFEENFRAWIDKLRKKAYVEIKE